MTVIDRFLVFRKLFEKLAMTHVTGHSHERRGTVMNTDSHAVRRMRSLSRIVENGIFSPFPEGRFDDLYGFAISYDAFQFFGSY